MVNTQYSKYVVELCTWNLYKFINQYHPYKFNKKEKIILKGEKNTAYAHTVMWLCETHWQESKLENYNIGF